MTGFVPASWLYDVETRSTRRHPAQQATDIEVREAIEDEPELVTDGGARVPGASYRVDCWSCGKQIAASARYCPGCGEVQLQGDEDPVIAADGGTCRDGTDRWEDRAAENVERWGNQTPAVLLLALAEEIGEVADEVLATGDNPLHDPMYSAEGIHLLSEVRHAGFACRDFLEEHFEDEDGDPLPEEEMPRIFHDLDEDRVLEEVDDSAPLLFQLSWALNGRSVDTGTEQDGGSR